MYNHLLSLDFYNIQGVGDTGASTPSTMALDAESQQETSSTATHDVIVGNVKGPQYNNNITYSISITVTMILSLLTFLACHSS